MQSVGGRESDGVKPLCGGLDSRHRVTGEVSQHLSGAWVGRLRGAIGHTRRIYHPRLLHTVDIEVTSEHQLHTRILIERNQIIERVLHQGKAVGKET